MQVEYDRAKRDTTLRTRGLDMAQANKVFDGTTVTIEDDRKDYGEPRYITIGFLAGRMVFVAWTPRANARRVISMRKANAREQALYGSRFRR